MSTTFSYPGRPRHWCDATTCGLPVPDPLYGAMWPDCPDQGGLNLSGRNAADLLRRMGYDALEYGSAPLAEFRQRCEALLRQPDEGVMYTIEREPGRPTMVGLGRRPGYVAERAQDLLRLCDEAAQVGDREIRWG